jgi:hypothetical protein
MQAAADENGVGGTGRTVVKESNKADSRPLLIVVINEGRIIVTDDDSAVGQRRFVPKGVKDIKLILEGVRK